MQMNHSIQNNKESENAALFSTIITDIHKISKKILIKLRNDAATFVNRIIPSLISLCSWTYDILDEACRLQAKILQTMKYNVQTALGIFK